MSMTVKAYLKRGENANAEIRRFVVDQTVASNYEYLSKKVAQVFPSLGSPDNFILSWKDSEGDLITFSSDDELMEALGQLSEDIFRVYVKERKRNRREGPCQIGPFANDGSAPGCSKGAEEEVYHPGVICDGCEKGIRGPRFKCVTCADYDLCRQCEERGTHAEHAFVKFRKPQVGRTHLGGFFNRPGMFRQFGYPGWRRWWANNQQQQQQQQSQQQGPTCQNQETQGAAGPGPQGPTGCHMGPGPFGGPPPPPPPHGCPPPPPPNVFLRDIGETVAQLLDPLGIDVDIDVEHNGERTHAGPEGRPCGGRNGGRHGRRHGRGRRGCRNTWAGPEQSSQDQGSPDPEGDGSSVAKEAQKEAAVAEGQESTSASAASAASGEKQSPYASVKDKLADAMDVGSSGNSGTNGGATGSDDADWTMVDDGVNSPAPAPAQNGSGDAPPFKYQSALTQMLAMGFNNDGGWLTSLLLAKEGDIGGVLDAIKIGNQPTYNVNLNK